MFLQPKPQDSDPEPPFSGGDAPLWAAFKDGSEEAFSRIYHLLVQDLYNYGLKVAADPELVEDCIQDLFIYIWDSKEKLGATDNIKFYLFTALKRRILVKKEEKHKKDNLLQAAHSRGEQADSSLESRHSSFQTEEDPGARLEQALQSLTMRQREAISLRFYDKMSYADIASMMSLTVPSTYSLIARAMEVLREQMLGLAYLLLVVC